MECTACGVLFDVGCACSCTSSSLPAAVAAPASQPTGVAEGGGLSAAPARRRGGIQTGELLSTNDVALKTAEVARAARSTYRRIAHSTNVARAKKYAEQGVPADIVAALADREITMRRTQLIALDTELKALRLAGAQAELREQDQRLDRLEKAVAQIKAGDLKREEHVN